MFTVDASRIRTLMFERGLSVTELAKKAKLNAITTARVLKGNATATSKTIAALAKFFGVDGNTLILKG